MTANDTTDDDKIERFSKNRRLGSRHASLAGVDGAEVSVKTPNVHTDEQIGVEFALDAEATRQLAARIARAADEAEADVPVDE